MSSSHVYNDSKTGENMAEFLEAFESKLHADGYERVCGVDEAGRGPLAGPVVAAAVILPGDYDIAGLNDSKKLSAAQRQTIYQQITSSDLSCAVGIIQHGDIDQMNIHKASLMAMWKAVSELQVVPDVVLVDGKFTVPKITLPQYAMVGGDRYCRAIAAASIVAKVTRDQIMERYQSLYPEFSFAHHKGYPTPLHLKELREHGPTEIHRKSYRPVAEMLEEQYVLF